MKSKRRLIRQNGTRGGLPPAQPERKGSVIIVVLVLTLGLLFLGVLLYTDAAQEDVNAEYFAKSTHVDVPQLEPEAIEYNVLRQVLLGTYDHERHSLFYGGRHSQLPKMLGNDFVPFSGRNVLVGGDPNTGNYFVDMDRDGNSDGPNEWVRLNLSPSANGGTDFADPGGAFRFDQDFLAPDGPSTYPDNNNVALFYQGWVPGPGGLQKVLIPSFHRPQLLRGIAPPNDWWTSSATLPYVLRPHQERRAIAIDPNDGSSQIPHYASTHPNAGQEIRRYISRAHREGTATPFPFVDEDLNNNGVLDPGEDSNGNGVLDTGVLFRHGVWSTPPDTDANGNYVYEYDVDLDDDGVKESIYLDLDLGVYDLPDGSGKFTPIVAIKMVPLDSNFDVNAHGNMNMALQSQPDGTVAAEPNVSANPYNGFLHRSNQGATKAEVNSQYGLLANPADSADPNADFRQHQLYYQRNPANALDLSGMEIFWLKVGRPQYGVDRNDVASLITGAFGEAGLMRDAAEAIVNGSLPPGMRFPHAGVTGQDDNGDARAEGAWAGQNQVFPNFVRYQPSGQPFDSRGRGRYIAQNGAGAHTQRLLSTVGPYIYPQYDGYVLNGDTSGVLTNVVQWPASLITGGAVAWLLDEPSEMTPGLYPAGTGDNRFAPGETLSLHMSASQRSAVNRTNDRLLRLAPWNFTQAPLDANDPPVNPRAGAANISKRFTTHTADMKSFGKAFNPNYRQWEFTQINPGVFEFPPQFTNVPSGGNHPLRPELRVLLRTVAGEQVVQLLQRRLSVNGFLDQAPNGMLRFRPLTPHVTGTSDGTPNGTPLLGNDPVSGTNSVVSSRFTLVRPEQIGPSTNYYRQEWLARFDRQRLCRDIYMLLYLFGGSNDGVNYATEDNSSFQVYTAEQLREMAQFAANLVDAMDPDDVPTVFEYDTNPANGWNLDDDPFTTVNELTSDPETERGLVYGVEAQQLAFSEALALLSKRVVDAMNNPVDHEATEHPDNAGDQQGHRFFNYIELENVTPRPVWFNNAAWQVVVSDAIPPVDPNTARVQERRLTLRSDTPGTLGVPAGAAGDVTGQQSRFLIAAHSDTQFPDPNDPNEIAPSLFRVDPNFTQGNQPNFTRIAPQGQIDLDLVRPPLNRYYLHNPPADANPPTPGDGPRQESQTNDDDPSGAKFFRLVTGDPTSPTELMPGDLDSVQPNDFQNRVRLQLRRRLNPHRGSPVLQNPAGDNNTHVQQSADNPWIVVDEMVVDLKMFSLEENSDANAIQSQLRQVFSSEREQPLDRNRAPDYPTTPANNYQFNSLGNVNQATATNLAGQQYTLYQPHFDRRFASVAELLSLPLYGPENLTRDLGTGATNQNPKISLQHTAANRFLQPDQPTGATIPNAGNRWYRVLELLEAPERNPTQNPWHTIALGTLNNPLFPFSHGDVNLNTLSEVEVFAGLLDDPDMFLFNANAAPFLDDQKAPGTRDWWMQFLRSRDGTDPVTGLPLPGVPGSGGRPFRELGFGRQGSNGYTDLEETVLRSLPADNGAGEDERRRLFEVGTAQQRQQWQTSADIDPSTRYRMLSKVMNNTTTRGNAFLLILEVQYFEAVEVDTDVNDPVTGLPVKAVRVGGKLASSPDARTYYIIDRSRALVPGTLTQADFPRPDPDTGRFSWSFRQDMSFQSLILDRQRVK